MDDYDCADELVRQCRPDVPVTCFRPAALLSAANWFTQNFNGKVLYAVKANPAPHVISGLYAAGITAFDVASLAEVQLIHSLCPNAYMAFMHPVKSRPAIEQAYFDYGIRAFSFDSLEEMEKITSATGNSKDLDLILRLVVPNTSCEYPLSGKFGVLPEKAAEMLKAARKVAKRIGISFHVGSQTMNPATYISALKIVRDILQSMPRVKVDIIDVGGGFPSAYPDMIPPALAGYKAAIEEGFNLLPRNSSMELWCEPGRALVAECSSVVVKVDLRKDDALYINDGTYGSLFDAGHSGFCYPVRLIRPTLGGTNAAQKPFRFYGPTCDSIDYMPGPFYLPEDTREGDYIEIGQLGAYGNALRTNFNGFYPHETVAVTAPPLLTMYAEYSDDADASETTDLKRLVAA